MKIQFSRSQLLLALLAITNRASASDRFEDDGPEVETHNIVGGTVVSFVRFGSGYFIMMHFMF